VLRAPFSGVVLTTHVEEGEVTAPGAPMVSLADTSSFHVDADLDEADLGRVREGMAAEVVLDAFPTERLPGRVTELAPSVTQDLRGQRSVAIRVALAPDPRLRVGMSADVDVVVATRDDAVHVPPNAVLGRGTDRAVWVVEGTVVRRRRIDVGVATWEAVEVLRGAREGERVVVSLATEQLTDGMRVTVRPTPQSSPAAP
jgi:RND family efflux transporter MFP subunit